MSYLTKKDGNHDELIAALAAACEAVEDTHRLGNGFPDTLALRDGTIHLIEIKMPGGKLTPRERAFHDKFTGADNLHIVENEDEILRAVGAIE